MDLTKAHAINPEITLDIYGRGEANYENYLKKIQAEYHTHEYVHFYGQQNVRDIYRQYPVFISSSLWETMGLSLMEAIGSGNAIIGLNARYGNWEFIKDKENGILVDFDIKNLHKANLEEETIDKLSQAILEVFNDMGKLEEYKEKSYEIASNYTDDVVEKKWLDFMKSLMDK